MNLIKNSHCSYCGNRFAFDAWPRHCTECQTTTWQNPIPAILVLVPVDGSLLLVRRAIAPHIGELALAGGFMDVGETWQEGGARELFEETGIKIDPSSLYYVDISTSEAGNLLIFCATPNIPSNTIKFVPNSEVSEIAFTDKPIELAFPTHTEYVARFLERMKNERSEG